MNAIIFPFSRINANAISALTAALDIDPILSKIPIKYPNFDTHPKELRNELMEFNNLIIAFSVFSTQFKSVINKIQEYKYIFKDKNILIIAGGPHAIGNPKSLLNNGVDIVCTGEGETVITGVSHAFFFGDNINIVKGIAFIDNGKFKRTPRAEPINLDDYPPFSIKHKIIRPIEITRGCAWKCMFCQTRNKNIAVRHRSVEKILEYVRYTVKHFNKRRPDIRFISPNALSYGSHDGKTVNITEIERLLAGIRNIIGDEGRIYFGSFPSEIRPETISEETVQLLKKYTNATKIAIGAQSGSNKILEIAHRGHDVSTTIKAVKLLIENGFNVDVDIIFGLPGEELEDVRLTIELMIKLTDMGAKIHAHTFMPLVGTPFANKPPGKIHPEYLKIIRQLQQKHQLSGDHIKQERAAKEMFELRLIRS